MAQQTKAEREAAGHKGAAREGPQGRQLGAQPG
jgi:hypothetical protein